MFNKLLLLSVFAVGSAVAQPEVPTERQAQPADGVSLERSVDPVTGEEHVRVSVNYKGREMTAELSEHQAGAILYYFCRSSNPGVTKDDCEFLLEQFNKANVSAEEAGSNEQSPA